MNEPITTLRARKIKQEHVPGKWLHAAFTATYLCGGKRFEILVTDNPPPGCDRDGAIEAGWARTTEDACFHGWQKTRDEDRHQAFLDDIAEQIKEIARPTILQMAADIKSDVGSESLRQDSEAPNVQDDGGCSSNSEVIELQLVTRQGTLQVIPGHYSGVEGTTQQR